MPDLAVSITKSTSWRGHSEQFSNVYHYTYGHAMSNAVADRLILALKAIEATVHTTQAAFVNARVWETGGTPAENETIRILDLTGTGSLSTAAALYKELAAVGRIDSGRNSTTGRKIYLRKYYHPCASPTSSSDANTGVAPMGSSMESVVQAAMNNIRLVVPATGEDYSLTSPSGQVVSPTAPTSVLPYFRVRQFTG